MSIRSLLVNYFFNKSDQKRDAGLITPDQIYRMNDICYGDDEKWQILDIYYPQGTTKKLPVIINVHGGGWVYGTKEVYQYYGMNLAERGFVVINFTYRLAPKYKFPTQLADINLVVKWVHKNYEAYYMDLNHIYMVGDSAGAHLTSLYTSFLVNKDYQKRFNFLPPKRFKLNAIALNCGIYDVYQVQAHTRNLLRDLLGRRFKSQLKWINAIDYVTKDFPPVYVMTASHDFLKDQAPLLVNALTKHQIEHTYELYSSDQMKLQHVFHVDVRNPNADICNNDECDFFKKY